MKIGDILGPRGDHARRPIRTHGRAEEEGFGVAEILRPTNSALPDMWQRQVDHRQSLSAADHSWRKSFHPIGRDWLSTDHANFRKVWPHHVGKCGDGRPAPS